MTINFHDPDNKDSYATRKPDMSWYDTIKKMVDLQNIHDAADVGCGGGIYARALADMGIAAITGIDSSKVMIEEAKKRSSDYKQIDFQVGSAYDTKLPNRSVDFLLERALIHHLEDLSSCFTEAFRILKHRGSILIQDRTPSDCLLEGSHEHIRGYFFSKFPHFVTLEMKRRYTSDIVVKALKAAGFTAIQQATLWETRKKYPSKDGLLADIRARQGRSILHELTDKEIEQLIHFMDVKLNKNGPIVDKDRWTIWMATKC
ncbi:class I SAM-dependent methyltransferase [Virgibacillus sp. NKC19-3]|uniref:class I SAM-dependent methyltransferase n=1 Tax=Virgibacillus saliphilus TaxID=2831674 RepID=UPI001C9B2F70|nr:class I SAM-dependent methyltransferase [Virgibacillus sp. NKC19-3]MBY7144896.1 class I SAM-dependent methyltransferase [Virgibacillus sp. NKC19-3]